MATSEREERAAAVEVDRKAVAKEVREFASWGKATADTYTEAALELISKGYGRREAVEFVERLYRAAASDYGE